MRYFSSMSSGSIEFACTFRFRVTYFQLNHKLVSISARRVSSAIVREVASIIASGATRLLEEMR